MPSLYFIMYGADVTTMKGPYRFWITAKVIQGLIWLFCWRRHSYLLNFEDLQLEALYDVNNRLPEKFYTILSENR